MPLDWGTVPSWLSAGSLLLAFRIFLKDRANNLRDQVDQIGIWLDVTEEFGGIASIKFHHRNASNRPARIVQFAYTLHTEWRVAEDTKRFPPTKGGNETGAVGIDQTATGDTFYWRSMTGTRLFETWHTHFPPLTLMPDSTKTYKFGKSLHNVRPEGALSLMPITGIIATINWCLIIDNAGNRWELRPGQASRARRITSMSRRAWRYPVSWQRARKLHCLLRSRLRLERYLWSRRYNERVIGDLWPGNGFRLRPYAKTTKKYNKVDADVDSSTAD